MDLCEESLTNLFKNYQLIIIQVLIYINRNVRVVSLECTDDNEFKNN